MNIKRMTLAMAMFGVVACNAGAGAVAPSGEQIVQLVVGLMSGSAGATVGLIMGAQKGAVAAAATSLGSTAGAVGGGVLGAIIGFPAGVMTGCLLLAAVIKLNKIKENYKMKRQVAQVQADQDKQKDLQQ